MLTRSSALMTNFYIYFFVFDSLDYGKKRGCTREEREKERLKHKYKREFKGALREIRKDSRFLAREKLNEAMSRWGEQRISLVDVTQSPPPPLNL